MRQNLIGLSLGLGISTASNVHADPVDDFIQIFEGQTFTEQPNSYFEEATYQYSLERLGDCGLVVVKDMQDYTLSSSGQDGAFVLITARHQVDLGKVDIPKFQKYFERFNSGFEERGGMMVSLSTKGRADISESYTYQEFGEYDFCQETLGVDGPVCVQKGDFENVSLLVQGPDLVLENVFNSTLSALHHCENT